MSQMRSPGPASRRVGYVAAVVVNAVLLVLINLVPGWQVVPFVTASFADALPLVNLSLWLSLLVNVVYLIRDPRWLVDVGETLTSVVAVAVSLRLLEVFPFDFAAYSFDWATVVRVVLWVAVVGGSIGVVASLVSLVRDVGGGHAVTR
jgi:hypothetical protein